jgi:hypothetical protein
MFTVSRSPKSNDKRPVTPQEETTMATTTERAFHETYWSAERNTYLCHDCDFNSTALTMAAGHQRRFESEAAAHNPEQDTMAEVRRIMAAFDERIGYKESERGITVEQDIAFTQAKALLGIQLQLAILNEHLRQQLPDAHLPQDCRERKCSYYTHYLIYGGPDLTHEGYHGAEKECEAAQRRAQEWMDNPANDGKDLPKGLEDRCKRWEQAVRA